ncbi:MAG: RNA degradosome polyphosphate kinase [Lachnospiraceae bacterium]|nr:RNA degradosome polyphosphate kinase [Lachnospiraceae bacterium]
MDFGNTEYYTNRELSWVRFNERVLSEARDKETPLFERLKFLSITASNLDEFFMVRVASLKDMVHAGYSRKDIAGLKPAQQLELLYPVLHDFVHMQYDCYRKLLKECASKGLRMVEHHEDLSAADGDYADRYFIEHVYPVLTPMAVDSSRPFPLIKNKSLNICALLVKKGKDAEKEKNQEFATVQVPSVLPRLVRLPDSEGEIRIIRLEEVIERNIHRLFLNYDVLGSAPFQIMRNADLTIEEEEAEDLLKEIEKQIRKRQWGEVIRLEAEAGIDKRLLKILKHELSVTSEDIYEIDGPLDLTFLMKVYGQEGFDEYKHVNPKPCEVPQIPPGSNVFEAIRKGDILLHHPYQSFEPVVEFIRQAAADPDVLAIKQTLYRVSGNSPIVRALAAAAENGKQVSVLVELKARFDEENNIGWARMLEKAGCHVIYGLVGLKTHCKIALVVRREEDGIRRYVHLGTGNYNDATARLYTDMGILSCAEPLGEDATAVFNMLSGYSEPLGWNELSLAPLWLKKRLLKLIRRETEAARAGRSSGIRAKMNSLCDPDVIAALYEASSAGVQIELLVRGICCLKTGIPGVSENIHVYSIVGNYLEHGRIFIFENDCDPEVFLASADWMPRNLERRVEIMFPVRDPALKKRVMRILSLQFADNVKKRILEPSGEYRIPRSKKAERYSCQEAFEKEAAQLAGKGRGKGVKDSRRFTPRSAADDE